MKKVLIVDDEENIVNALRRYLKKKNLEIHSVNEFHQAKFELTKQTFDIIFLDLRLENTLDRNSGIQLLQDVREYNPHAKIIVMTGFGSAEIAKKAYESGAYFYTEKPFDFEALNKCLSELGVG